MPKKICNDGCGCDKCKTTTKKKKTKSKPKKAKIAREIIKSIMPNMRLMTNQPDYTIQNIPLQFNTPKDILDIKNSLVELLQKEKKKLSGVISTQTEDMHEIVDDIATEKAINSIGNRNNNETEYRPKSPKREGKSNNDFTPLDSPFDIGRYKAKSPKFEEKSNNDFETSSDTFFARPQTSFKADMKYNNPNTANFENSSNPITTGNFFHNETFNAEIPDRIITPLEIRRSVQPTISSLWGDMSLSALGRKGDYISPPSSPPPPEKFKFFHSETFDAEYKPTLPNSVKSNNDFEVLDSPLDFGIYNPKLPKSEEKFNGFKTSSDKFFATPQTSFKSNKPNIFLYEDDEDYGRPREDFATLPKIRKYGKSDKQIEKEAKKYNLNNPIETVGADYTHTRTTPDKAWITP